MNLKLNGNGHQNGHSPKPYLKYALLAVAILLVGILLYRQIDRLASSKKTVWVAAAPLPIGHVLQADDFEQKSVNGEGMPQGAVADLKGVIGKQLTRGLAAGAPLLARNFAANNDPGSITRLVPEGRVMMTLRVDQKALPLTELRRGDRLDVLLVGGSNGGRSLAADVYFVGWIQSGNGGGAERQTIFGIDVTPPGRSNLDSVVSILLAVRPEDVYRVAWAQSASSRISVVLHGSTEVREGELLALPSPRASKVDLIAGANRESVSVKQ